MTTKTKKKEWKFPRTYEFRRMNWDNFIKSLRDAKKHGGFVEMEMYRNYFLRFAELERGSITIDQQSMYNLKRRKVVSKKTDNADLRIWWNEKVRPEITRVRFKNHGQGRPVDPESNRRLKKGKAPKEEGEV